MTRGNQREIDRARAQKRAEKKGGADKQTDFQKRMMTDAEKMREKQKKAEEKKQKEEEDKIKQGFSQAQQKMGYMKQFEEININEQDEQQQNDGSDENEEEKKEPVEMMKASTAKGTNK